MEINMGYIDRFFRLLIAVVINYLYFTDVIHGTWGIALMILAVIFALTSFFGFCPLYKVLGIKTIRKKD